MCRRLAGSVLGREFPGMTGAPTISQVRRRVKSLEPELVEYARCPVRKSRWLDNRHEATIAELTAAARAQDARAAAEREGRESVNAKGAEGAKDARERARI
jgi:hypothetical protein